MFTPVHLNCTWVHLYVWALVWISEDGLVVIPQALTLWGEQSLSLELSLLNRRGLLVMEFQISTGLPISSTGMTSMLSSCLAFATQVLGIEFRSCALVKITLSIVLFPHDIILQDKTQILWPCQSKDKHGCSSSLPRNENRISEMLGISELVCGTWLGSDLSGSFYDATSSSFSFISNGMAHGRHGMLLIWDRAEQTFTAWFASKIFVTPSLQQTRVWIFYLQKWPAISLPLKTL